MSVQAISWVIDHSQQKGGAFAVLLMIANHAHSDGNGAFPSFDTLARESRMSYRQVTRIVPLLAKSGELIVLKGEGPRGVNLYSFPLMRDILSRDNGNKQGQNVGTSAGLKCPPNRKEPKFKTEPNYRALKTHATSSLDSRAERQEHNVLQQLARIARDHDLEVAIHAGTGPRG